jgi:hypothetical protein
MIPQISGRSPPEIPENAICTRTRFPRLPRGGATGQIAIDCVGRSAGAVTERPDLTARGYRRFRCRDCDKQFNERSDGVLNRASLPSDIIAFVVFCRLRYRLTLRDLSEIMLLRGCYSARQLTSYRRRTLTRDIGL